MVWPSLGWRTAKEQKSNTLTYVLNKAGVKRELLDIVKTRKLAYHGHTIRKRRSCLEKEIMPGARRRGRPHMAWTGNSIHGQDSSWKSQSERQR